jgi:hypothetical protein
MVDYSISNKLFINSKEAVRSMHRQPDPVLLNRVTRDAFGVLLLTSVHHAYGAYVYHTPWRLHVLLVALLVAAGMLGLLPLLRRPAGDARGRIAFWAFAAIVLIVPIGLIGLFEGGYNHAIKNALYFGGASAALMNRLFPPPTYELPNDAFFEVTGIAQVVWGVIAGSQLIALIRDRLGVDS